MPSYLLPRTPERPWSVDHQAKAVLGGLFRTAAAVKVLRIKLVRMIGHVRLAPVARLWWALFASVPRD